MPSWWVTHFFRDDILIGWLVNGVKWIVRTNISVFLAHFDLITVLVILLIEVIDNALLNGHLIQFLTMIGGLRINLDVDLRAKWSEVRIKALFASKWSIRVKLIIWRQV